MPSHEHHSDDCHDYKFFPVKEFSMKVSVKATNDAHICLPSDSSDDKVEIFLGGWSNQKSAIRLNGAKPDVVKIETEGLLSADEHRVFVINWTSEGKVEVFKKGDEEPLMKWDLEHHFEVKKVGVRTGWGSEGEWEIDGAKKFNTGDVLDYHFFKAHSGVLNFKVKAANDAHIILSENEKDEAPCYEVFIGGWTNSKSAIRLNKTKPNVEEETRNDTLSSEEYRKFWVKWSYKKIEAGEDGQKAFLKHKLESPEDISIMHFGIRTGWGSAGDWKLHCKPSKH